MIKVESARGRQITLAQLVVACRQRIRGQRQLVARRTGKLAEWIRLVCPVESRRTWSVMVDAVLAALVIVEQTLAQFGHLAKAVLQIPLAFAQKMRDAVPEYSRRAKRVVSGLWNDQPGLRSCPRLEERARTLRWNDGVGLTDDRQQRHSIPARVRQGIEEGAEPTGARQPQRALP